jgi:hypothetical protein
MAGQDFILFFPTDFRSIRTCGSIRRPSNPSLAGPLRPTKIRAASRSKRRCGALPQRCPPVDGSVNGLEFREAFFNFKQFLMRRMRFLHFRHLANPWS